MARYLASRLAQAIGVVIGSASAETAANYAIRSSFHGQDTSAPPNLVDRVATHSGAAAYFQSNSERVVNVRFSSPISPIQTPPSQLPVKLMVQGSLR